MSSGDSDLLRIWRSLANGERQMLRDAHAREKRPRRHWPVVRRPNASLHIETLVRAGLGVPGDGPGTTRLTDLGRDLMRYQLENEGMTP